MIGAGIVLKVMAGDHVDANVLGAISGLPNNIQTPLDPNKTLSAILSNLFAGGVVTQGGEAGFTPTNGSALLAHGIEDFLNTQDNYEGNQSAYLNWVLLDAEQFKLVSGSSGFTSLMDNTGNPGDPAVVLQANNGDGIDIVQNGYLYVYVSNTNTKNSVFFDNLSVVHTRGALLEEDAYYPFGLEMKSI